MQGFFGTGYFLEGRKKPDAKYSYLRQLEKKKILSGVERIKLLSKLEKAGLTLSKVRLQRYCENYLVGFVGVFGPIHA